MIINRQLKENRNFLVLIENEEQFELIKDYFKKNNMPDVTKYEHGKTNSYPFHITIAHIDFLEFPYLYSESAKRIYDALYKFEKVGKYCYLIGDYVCSPVDTYTLKDSNDVNEIHKRIKGTILKDYYKTLVLAC